MKYKIGQKVRVVEWLDMPVEIRDAWGINSRCIGFIGTIASCHGKNFGINTYDIKFDKEIEKYPLFVFEYEIEPVLRKGEQLLLFEL